MNSKISVVLCTYNGAPWLPRQLRSLLVQQRPPDELVVRDDASSDETPNILRDFATTAPFPVRVTTNPNRLGIAANFQAGFADASGDVILPCDQDDVWYPEKIGRFASVFDRPSPPDLAFCDADLVDEQLRPLGRRQWDSLGFTPRRQSAVGLWSVLAKFNVVTGVGMGFSARRRDLLLPIPDGWLHDGWIGLILSAAGKCQLIPEPLVAYRQHPRQQIGGAPRTFSGRIAAARRMDQTYFLRLADQFRVAAERLRDHGITGPAVDLFSQKSDHCRRRAENRFSNICQELTTGRYFSCSLGWQSVVQDLLFRPRRISQAY